jgi:hypothetical protein
MRNLLARRAATLFAAAATIIVMGAGVAQAQPHFRYGGPAIAQSSARTRFTCPSRNVCLFKGLNGTEAHKAYPAAQNHSRCISTTVGGEHAGSLNDKTGSIIIVYDNTTGHALCLQPGKYNLDHAYGEWYLMYNVHTCPQSPPNC